MLCQPYLLLRTLAIVRPTFPTVTRLPCLRPSSFFPHGQFATTSCPILRFRPFFSFCLSSNSFLFCAFRLLTQHSMLPVPTFREQASGSKHVTRQMGLCFQRCVWRVASTRLSFDPLSHPILFLSGKCNLAASLNCVCAASKLLSPSPPLHSSVLDLFVGNWTKAFLSFVRNNGHCKLGLG